MQGKRKPGKQTSEEKDSKWEIRVAVKRQLRVWTRDREDDGLTPAPTARTLKDISTDSSCTGQDIQLVAGLPWIWETFREAFRRKLVFSNIILTGNDWLQGKVLHEGTHGDTVCGLGPVNLGGELIVRHSALLVVVDAHSCCYINRLTTITKHIFSSYSNSPPPLHNQRSDSPAFISLDLFGSLKTLYSTWRPLKTQVLVRPCSASLSSVRSSSYVSEENSKAAGWNLHSAAQQMDCKRVLFEKKAWRIQTRTEADRSLVFLQMIYKSLLQLHVWRLSAGSIWISKDSLIQNKRETSTNTKSHKFT